MYFVPPRKRPVGARVPGSSKSFIMAAISSGLYCSMQQETCEYKNLVTDQAGEGNLSHYAHYNVIWWNNRAILPEHHTTQPYDDAMVKQTVKPKVSQ
uniref:Uncharacterized protein n=2 Tax=Arundo donax TaxID=35708 RepID=A0A0A9EYC2_ARUDO